ncbi:MAG: hypothetical protein ACOCWG_03205 [bacterium]
MVKLILLLSCLTYLLGLNASQKEIPEKKEIMLITLGLVPNSKDTAFFYLPLIAKTFSGKIINHSPDSFVFTIINDSLDRTMYFLKKLGKIKNYESKTIDITVKYNKVNLLVDSLQIKYNQIEKELIEAQHHEEAEMVEKKLLIIQDQLKPLKKELDEMNYHIYHPQLILSLHEY